MSPLPPRAIGLNELQVKSQAQQVMLVAHSHLGSSHCPLRLVLRPAKDRQLLHRPVRARIHHAMAPQWEPQEMG